MSLSVALLGLFLALLAISMACLWVFQAQVWRATRRPVPAAPAPPVSILKPLAGLDEGLLDNLRSIARQNYPRLEIIFGIQDPSDPACAVVQAIGREFPQVPMRLVLGSPALGRNPKVSNLAGMTVHAQHAYILVSDANVRAAPDYLRQMMAEFSDPAVGLVSSVIGAGQARSIGAACEDLHLNTFVAPAICAAQELKGHPCVVGKSMLMRRADLATVGGWERVRDVLAEDYVLGQAFHAAGFRVALSPHVIEAVHVRRSIRQFASRHLRWAQMRRQLTLAAYVGELLLNPVPTALAVAVLALASGQRWALAVAAAAVLGKCVGDGMVASLLRRRRVPLWQVALTPLKDLLVAGIWLVGFFKRGVTWRGNLLTLGPGSVLRPAAPRRQRRPGARRSPLSAAAAKM